MIFLLAVTGEVRQELAGDKTEALAWRGWRR
jgi:hypothetical protein